MSRITRQTLLVLEDSKIKFLTFLSIIAFSLSAHLALGHPFELSTPADSIATFIDEEIDLNSEDSTQADIKNRIEQIVHQSEALWQKDKSQSEALILDAFKLLKQENLNDSLKARIYHLYGKILVDKRQNLAGIDTLLRCIEIKKQVFGDKNPELANTYNYLGIGYLQMRQYEDAMNCFNRSKQILSENKLINNSLYDANLNMGIVKAAKGQYAQAYKHFNNARIVINAIGPSVDSLLVARFYLNYGLMATLMGKFDEAIQYYSTAESIYKIKNKRDYLSLARIKINKGINAYYKYDYEKAILYYKEALNVYLNHDKRSIAIPRSYNNLSAVCIKTGDYSESIQYCLSGLKYNPDNYLKVLIFQNLADAYAALGENDKAEHYYLEAIDLLQSSRANPTKNISLYKSYADFLFSIQRFRKSKIYFDIALEKSRLYNRSNSEVYASLLSQIGDFYRYSNTDLDSALFFYNQAIAAWSNIFAKQDTATSGSYYDIRFLDAYLGKARLLAALYKKQHNLDLLINSINIYKGALERAGKISGKLSRENQLLLNEQFKVAYEEAIDIAYMLYTATSDIQFRDLAFEYGERLKSSVLLAAVQNINALKTTDVPQQVVQSELELQREVNGMKKLLAEEKMKARPSIKKTEFFNSRLLKLMISYDSLVKQIEQNYPRYFALKYDHSVINVHDLDKQLRPDEVILEYVLTDSTLSIFAFGAGINHFSQITLDTLFHRSLDHLINIKNIDLSQSNKRNMTAFINDAHLLWNYLVQPVYHQLKGKKIIIIPDGMLGYLSFDLLLSSDEVPDQLDYRLLPYLFKEFPLSYSYSASIRFNKYFKRKPLTTGELIAFAPDYKFEKGMPNTGLSLLPNSAEEAIEVASILGGDTYLEEEATKSKFLQEAGKYKVIHLAMHTIINDSLPMLSELLFYRGTNPSSDNKMHTYEVFSLNLSAKLVVLSACNTGYGHLQKGEGIMSLARGFKYAGVPSIVFTLWEVQDKATSGIMKQFYAKLKNGERKDVALQKAKLDYLSEANQLKSHPYYWSSFLITGDTEQITNNNENEHAQNSVFFGILLLISLIAVAVIWKKKQRKTT